MNPKKTRPVQKVKPIKISVFLPPDMHAGALKQADGRSLSSWVATLVAQALGTKGYTPPRSGRPAAR